MQSIFKICCLSLLFSAHAFNRPMRSHKFVTKMSSENGFAELVKNIKTYTLPAIIGASLLLAPHNADALPSGGRGGGSSFRSAPTRSSSRSYSSRSYSSSSTVFVPVPSYSPFGFGFGYATPFFFPPISFNTLVLAGAIAGAYYLLSNRVGGSDFSNSEDEGMLGSGATVIKLQLSLDADWSSGNIMETLATIAASNGGPSSRSSLSQLLSETSLALLRRQRDWNSVAYEGQKFNRFEGQQIEPYYQKVAVKERTKFETETSPVATLKGTTSRVSTQAVVSVIVAIRGSSNAFSRSLQSTSDVKECLQNLATDALTDEGDNVMAVEVLWTPSEPGVTLSALDVIENYPELMRL